MVANLILHQRIKTTLAKATELQKHTNHVIDLALRQKNPTPHIGPQDYTILRHISHIPAINTLKTEIAPLFKNYKKGDYTYIEKLGKRGNDKAQMAHIYINKSSKYHERIHSPQYQEGKEKTKRMKEYSLMLLNEEVAFFDAKKKEYSNLKSIAEKEGKPKSEIDKYGEWIAQVDRNILETQIDMQTTEIRGERKVMKAKMKKIKNSIIASVTSTQ
jgi:ribosomal protein L17